MGQAMFWVTQHCGKDEILISERNLAPGSQISLLGAKFRSRESNLAPGFCGDKSARNRSGAIFQGVSSG